MPDLLSLSEALDLENKRANRLYRDHLNPGLLRIYQALGLDDLDVVRAEGLELSLADGRTLLDFSASIGVLALGHNHPRILAAENLCHRRRTLDAIKVAPHKLQGALAYNLAQMLPDPLDVTFFSISGAEAVEAALKICEKAQGPDRRIFLTADGSFHGKTHGALSVTHSGGFQRGFLYGIPAENVIAIPFGDAEALERVLDERGSEIIAFIVEPLQGESIATPPPGYLSRAVERCRARGVLTIFDEVKVGMGRCGTFCAFEADGGPPPDVVTLSKALGGGKRAIAAMVSSAELFDRAYGKRQDCALHTSTFSGLGSSCAVAIETLNVYQDEGLVERTGELGRYLRAGLEGLQASYPDLIVELLGRGLFQGIRFNFTASWVGKLAASAPAGVFKTAEGVFMAATVRELYRRHGILVHFAASAPSTLHIMPPLIVERVQIDRLIEALDGLLARGLGRAVSSFISGNVLRVARGG